MVESIQSSFAANRNPSFDSGRGGATDLASILFGNSQSPFGGVNINALVDGILKELVGNSDVLSSIVKELSKFLSPLERGSLERLLGDAGTTQPTTPNATEPNTTNTTEAVAAGAILGAVAQGARAQKLPPRAADSAKVPSLETIAKDPVVTAAINRAWTNSNPNTAGKKQETGFWVVRDDKTGKLSIVQFPSNGTRDSLTPGPVPSSPGKTVVAFFHTHPNTVKEGYVNGPSPADQNFATANGIPGIIRSHAGMYYFTP
jgi:hypothetical protein